MTQMVAALRKGLAAIDASLPFFGSATLQDFTRDRIWTQRLITVMLGLFAIWLDNGDDGLFA